MEKKTERKRNEFERNISVTNNLFVRIVKNRQNFKANKARQPSFCSCNIGCRAFNASKDESHPRLLK